MSITDLRILLSNAKNNNNLACLDFSNTPHSTSSEPKLLMFTLVFFYQCLLKLMCIALKIFIFLTNDIFSPKKNPYLMSMIKVCNCTIDHNYLFKS